MNRIKDNLKDQGVLFSTHYIGDRLAKDHPVYQFDELLNAIDISPIMNKYTTRGGAMYCPRNMLALLTYAYLEGITSSRKIASLIQYHLVYIYLAGGNQIKYRAISAFRRKHLDSIKGIFLQSVSLALKIKLVKTSDVFALDGSKIEADVSSSKTKRKAQWEYKETELLAHVENFLDQWEKNDIMEEGLENEEEEHRKKVSERLQQLKKKRESLRTQLESNITEEILEPSNEDISRKTDLKEPSDEDTSQKTDGKETSDEYPSRKADVKKPSNKDISRKTDLKEPSDEDTSRKTNVKKPENISDCEQLLKNCEKITSMLEVNADVPSDRFLNLTDPDSRLMKSDSTIKECFNAQVITNNQVIVAVDVTNQENDQNQLIPMVNNLKKNLPSIASKEKIKEEEEDQNITSPKYNKKEVAKPIKFLTDAGYNQGKNLEYLDKEKNIDAYLSMRNRKQDKEAKSNPCHQSNFHYNEDEDDYTCPKGNLLDFKNNIINNDRRSSLYASDVSKCILCDMNSSCLYNKSDRKRGYRTITHDDYEVYRIYMRSKMEQDTSKKLYKGRSPEVEGLFGQITSNRGFDRFGLRGLKAAKGEFMIAAFAHNIGKIMKHQEKNRKDKSILSIQRAKAS